MFQNSKYNSSKGGYSERYTERARNSPNGNTYSPDTGSPRDRSYQNKQLYLQKMRDKERDRDYTSSRDKYSGKQKQTSRLSSALAEFRPRPF